MNRFSTKTKVVLGLILLSILSLVYLGLNIKKPASTSKPPLPQINVPPAGVSAVQLELPSSVKINIPATLNVYLAGNSALSPDQVKQIAAGLNFSEAGKVINDPIYGPTSIWSTPEKSLVVKNRDRLISLGTNSDLSKSPAGFKVSSEQILKKVNDYLNSLPTPKYTFNTRAVTYFKINGFESSNVSQPDTATIAKVSFAYDIDHLPIISPLFNNAFPTVTVDTNGKILAFDLTLPPALNEPEARTTYSLAEIKSLLPTAKLITFDNPNTQEALTDYFQDTATVTNVYLAYYQYLQQSTFQPVVVIEASGKTKSGNTATAAFVLPAVK